MAIKSGTSSERLLVLYGTWTSKDTDKALTLNSTILLLKGVGIGDVEGSTCIA